MCDVKYCLVESYAKMLGYGILDHVFGFIFSCHNNIFLLIALPKLLS